MGWHYTCRNDDQIWPVGYDSPYRTCPDCEGREIHCETCGSKHYVEVEAHSPHATREEAYWCATEFTLDTAKFSLRVSTTHSVPRCEFPDCGVLVMDGGGASYGFGIGNMAVLCDGHRNRDGLAVIVGTVGMIASS